MFGVDDIASCSDGNIGDDVTSLASTAIGYKGTYGDDDAFSNVMLFCLDETVILTLYLILA